MKKLILILMLFSGCQGAWAQQVQTTLDVLPNTNSADSTAVLNNQLRQNQNAINAIGGYFNNNNYLTPANGGTGTNLTTVTNGSILVWDAGNVGIGTFNPGISGQYLQSQGIGVFPKYVNITYSGIVGNYAAGNYLIAGPSTFGNISGLTSPVKLSEIVLPRAGTLRVKFTLISNDGGVTTSGQIYRNGVAVGTLQTISTATTAFDVSEDIAGWSAGDLLQLYGNVSANSGTEQVGALKIFENAPATELFGLGGLEKTSGSLQYSGIGAPQSVSPVFGNIGDTYINFNGGTTTTLYVKTATSTWTAK